MRNLIKTFIIAVLAVIIGGKLHRQKLSVLCSLEFPTTAIPKSKPFVFMLVLYNLGDFTTGLKPVVVGLVIFVIGAGLGTTTGFALNPARDWGPRLAYTIIPVPNKSRAMWDYAWVPMLGPLAGALLATLLQMTVK